MLGSCDFHFPPSRCIRHPSRHATSSNPGCQVKWRSEHLQSTRTYRGQIMNAFKLLVALSLLTNPDASAIYEPWNDPGPLAGWDEYLCSEQEPVFPFVEPILTVAELLGLRVPSAEQPSPDVMMHAVLAVSVRQLAIGLELFDPRETEYLLHDPQNFNQDLKQLQRRYQELADAPAAAECDRFPDRDAIGELLSLNRTYREEMCRRLEIDPANAAEIEQIIAETDQLYRIWNTAREARCGFYYVNVRRSALKQLRDLIGEPAFYRGELPPCVPVWRIPHR